MKNNAKKSELTYEVVEKIGVLASKEKTSTELRLVKWNDGESKYDIRSWWIDKDGNERCGKGLCLTKEEIQALAVLIEDIE